MMIKSFAGMKWRGVVGLLSAYAFVLQVLLLSVMASQAAAAGHDANNYVICFGSGNDAATDTPSGQIPAKVHCSLLCAQAMSAVGPAPSAAPLGFIFGSGAEIKAAAIPALSIPAPPSPKLSQGPPQIA